MTNSHTIHKPRTRRKIRKILAVAVSLPLLSVATLSNAVATESEQDKDTLSLMTADNAKPATVTSYNSMQLGAGLTESMPKATLTPYVSLDNRCFTMRINTPDAANDPSSRKFVSTADIGYPTNAEEGQATPIAFEATTLGRYRLVDQQGRPLFASIFDEVWAGKNYGDRADWTITPKGDAFTIVATKTGQQLGTRFGKLAVGGGDSYKNTTFTLIPASGCAQIPHGQINMISEPTEPTVNPDGTLNGIIDAHQHLLSVWGFGGHLFCGKPFHPGGIQEALAPCESHRTGAGTFFEMLLAGTKMYGNVDGWPTFTNRPTPTALLHQTGYYTGLERAWKAGVRALNVIYVGNRVICDIYPIKGTSCNEMEQVRAQAAQMQQLIDYVDAQNGGPGKGFLQIARTPADMRRIVASGKMAVSIGIEVSELFGCTGITSCSKEDIDKGLDELEKMGVSNVFPIHKFDNAFGGTRFDNGTTGTIMTFGNVVSNGTFFQVEKCEGEGPADLPLVMNNDKLLDVYKKVFGKDYDGALPIYPSGKICNRKGLTELGEYLIRQLMDRGMVINVDHMSVKTIKRTLEITKEAGYPGVMSNHTWSDPLFYEEIIKQGGFYASYLSPTDKQVNDWRSDHSVTPSLNHFGLGTDINGMGPLPVARKDAATNPLKYPITAPSGAVFDRNVTGERTWDFNKDGMSHYGLLADYLTDLLQQAGKDAPQMKKELMSSTEAYVRTWEGAVAYGNKH
ncbi:hypothetical protein JOD55_000154 [Arcanobacterium pluranimalium]|uniref:membrane dipeptidase n=1 Tax=Arcanobacterium pluranimalium TaxID=108028 RepID=UPI00195A3F69|nr:membrane dipeptidase [Arcanobacterium pluranimalium]MBM7824327.1 hypothetical protein [Arcanobacterium pluranimalium]